jgi:hypothetical protein
MARWTTSQVLALYNAERVIGIVNETVQTIPELNSLFAIPIAKKSYKTLVRTALPETAFRLDNTGRPPQKSTLETREVVCKFLDASWEIDQKVAKEFDWGTEMLLLNESQAHLQSAFMDIAVQTWYGTAADVNGFTGIASYFPNLSAPNLISAGGTTANGCTSVYALCTGLQKVGYVWGERGKLDVGDIHEERLSDSSGNPFYGYAQKIQGHIGLQVASVKCLGRICNIDAAHPVDDNMIAALCVKMGTGFKPDMLFMNAVTQEQLRLGRQQYYHTPNVAIPTTSTPDSSNGVPIYVTDAVKSTEAVLAAA